jgi:hypothetical protein
MGAAAGHMLHIYDNPSLTFREIKDIFRKVSEGKMLVTEKLDGICVHLSYSVTEGKVKAARNHKTLSEGGLSLDNIDSLAERQEAKISLGEAIKTFESIVKQISIDEQIEIFGPNANYFYNCEVQDPKNINVLLYDRPTISIHRSGHIKVNKYNKKVFQETLGKEFIKLEKLLLSNITLNETVSDGFIVKTNEIRKIPELTDKSKYALCLNSLQTEMKRSNVNDRSSIAEYILNRLDTIIESKIKLPRSSKIKLLERLMKAEGVTAKQVYETLNKDNCPQLIEKVRDLINSEKKLIKESIYPLEEIVTNFGAIVLSEFRSSYIKEPEKEIKRLKEKLTEIFDIVGNSGNPEAQQFLNTQFSRIKNIDNINSACEGVVFKYNDNIYKLTGYFSPLNQILGMLNYQRGNVPPLKTIMPVVKENKQPVDTVVVSWGRFNPPTIGHELVFRFGTDLANKNNGNFFIIPTKTVDKQKNPLTLQEKISYISKMFPEYASNVIGNQQINTIIEAAKYFSNKGYSNIKLVVGSDRKTQFEELLNKYNGKEYKYNTIEVISAGERLDADEGTAGMSASKMREAALQGDINSFMKGCAGRLELNEGVELMNLIRSRIEVVEDGKKKVLQPLNPSLLAEIIRKSGNKWCLFSKKKTKDGKRKKLGCYNSRNGAKNRERQVQYFKHMKEEQDLEEISAVSAGAVTGHVSQEKDLGEENIFLNRPGAGSGFTYQSRFGSSQKRDDEPGRKNIIKVVVKTLLMEEEQYMIDRKEFIEEVKLRKLIREGLRIKMKERQQKVLNEEKELRLIIRKLLQEKEEEPAHPITGINILRDLLKKIIPVLEGYYKDLTTSQEQRKSFRAHIVNATKNLLDIEDSPQEDIGVELKEKELQEQEQEETSEDPRFIPIDRPKTSIPMPAQEEPDTFGIEGLDTTGRDVAAEAFKKIEKQIKNAYAVLSDKKDKEAFREYLLTNELLHMDKFEKAMQPVVKEPSTPSYEKEKNKMDSGDVGTTTSQLPSSTPQQTLPISPTPVGEKPV